MYTDELYSSTVYRAHCTASSEGDAVLLAEKTVKLTNGPWLNTMFA